MMHMTNGLAQVTPVSYDEQTNVLVVRYPDGSHHRFSARMSTVMTWQRQKKSDQYFKWQILNGCRCLDDEPAQDDEPIDGAQFPEGHPLRKQVRKSRDVKEVEGVAD